MFSWVILGVVIASYGFLVKISLKLEISGFWEVLAAFTGVITSIAILAAEDLKRGRKPTTTSGV